MSSPRTFRVAVVGATGLVGETMIKVLEERNFPVSELFALASSRSIGKTVKFHDKGIAVDELEGFDFSKVDIGLFSAGGEISLALTRQNGNAEIVVRDTGIGIPEVDRQRIFDRFYRVDKARSRALGGAGLGLSIVRWIVEVHGGEIHIDSAPGRGSTFTVDLPLKA